MAIDDGEFSITNPKRGSTFCRGCGKENLFSALNLGDLPIANELMHSKEDSVDRYPLELRICIDCGLGQVADVVPPERFFRKYNYLSSMSNTFLKHAKEFVEFTIESGMVASYDWVLEIASNDGYLLQYYLDNQIEVLGIEPATNISTLAKNRGIPTISEFFTADLAKRIFLEKGFPKLIVANNVLAHVPDLNDFLNGISILCGPNTVVSIENPPLANIFNKLQFDTIYHEHYSYLSVTAVRNLARNFSLELYNINHLPTHGGSIRFWLKRNSTKRISNATLEQELIDEQKSGLFSLESWSSYEISVKRIISDFENWTSNMQFEGRPIYGYGAAAKASTFLNACKLDSDTIRAIADKSVEKVGRFMPSIGIPIISTDELAKLKPKDVVIFPWNLKAEIIETFKSVDLSRPVFWTAIPQLGKV